MRRLGLALALSAALMAQAPPADEAVGQAAPGTGTAALSGRFYEESRTSRAGDRPLAGVTIMLGPSSPELLARLEDVKAHARDSSQTYRMSGGEIRRAIEAYERGLDARGMAEMVVRVPTGADGSFSIPNLAPGRWLLVGVQTVRVDTHGKAPQGKAPQSPQARLSFRDNARLRGYDSLTVWLRELDLTGGQASQVELTDRHVWFTAIQEDRGPDAGR
jgi:hypothetical protein